MKCTLYLLKINLFDKDPSFDLKPTKERISTSHSHSNMYFQGVRHGTLFAVLNNCVMTIGGTMQKWILLAITTLTFLFTVNAFATERETASIEVETQDKVIYWYI